MYLCNRIAPEHLGGKNGQIPLKAAPPDSQGQPRIRGMAGRTSELVPSRCFQSSPKFWFLRACV